MVMHVTKWICLQFTIGITKNTKRKSEWTRIARKIRLDNGNMIYKSSNSNQPLWGLEYAALHITCTCSNKIETQDNVWNKIHAK